MGKLSQLRHGLTGKPVEKIVKKISESGVKYQPSPIRCVGSKTYPDCRLPLFSTETDKKLRDTILYGFEVSRNCPNGCHLSVSDFKNGQVGETCPKCLTKLVSDDEDRKIFAEILDQCVYCIVEHPEVRPTYSSMQLRLWRSGRKILERLYSAQ